MLNLIIDEDVKLWYDKQYNMIFSDPRDHKGSSSGCWRHVADIHILCSSKEIKHNKIDSKIVITPFSFEKEAGIHKPVDTRQFHFGKKTYIIGAKFGYPKKQQQAITYNLNFQEELFSVTQSSTIRKNYLLEVHCSSLIYVLIEDRIFPLSSINVSI
tara:strand:- start:258 stop:728 length:471 start_codon:yes stop_codon:yes gene_type:complete